MTFTPDAVHTSPKHRPKPAVPEMPRSLIHHPNPELSVTPFHRLSHPVLPRFLPALLSLSHTHTVRPYVLKRFPRPDNVSS
ncbi:hypothetical protein LX36DRAFT_656080 [Colletotrichum falcatum]|nr:hypothetical protein LX36DRAFT_656080 [Colletotrichum falcatum]